MEHYQAYYRHHHKRIIHRNVNMLPAYGGRENMDAWTHEHSGSLSNGNIHCSCPICRRKSYDEAKHRDAKLYPDGAQQLDEVRKGSA